jgi:hypothetical protein
MQGIDGAMHLGVPYEDARHLGYESSRGTLLGCKTSRMKGT